MGEQMHHVKICHHWNNKYFSIFSKNVMKKSWTDQVSDAQQNFSMLMVKTWTRSIVFISEQFVWLTSVFNL